MFLGIEIGGTKLQLAVGRGDGGDFVEQIRQTVIPENGAAGILRQIEADAPRLIKQYDVRAVGIGFGGPVSGQTGVVVTSHQIDGWDELPLASHCRQLLGVPVAVGNDCDVAALAESRFGAGRDRSVVFFVTVGTGIGGGLVVDGRLHGRQRPAAAEIGHLRPGVHADNSDATVESVASGWGIVAATQARLTGQIFRPLDLLWASQRSRDARVVRKRLLESEAADRRFHDDLRQRCGGDYDLLTAEIIATAAAEGNRMAAEILQHAWQTLGWAVAQAVTLIAPDVVVVGGGVSLIGESGFFAPLRRQVERYVFPPLRGSYEILPAALGEWVVVQGAIALAADHSDRLASN